MKIKSLMAEKQTIRITAKDLSTPEKTENLMTLLGRSRIYKGLKDMSIAVHGDGALERLMDKTEPLNPSKEADAEKYEALQAHIKKESARLTPIEKAGFDVEVTDQTVERLFENRELAKKVLGNRYYDAVFPLGATADRKTLRNYNPNFQGKPKATKATVSFGDDLSRSESKEAKEL